MYQTHVITDEGHHVPHDCIMEPRFSLFILMPLNPYFIMSIEDYRTIIVLIDQSMIFPRNMLGIKISSLRARMISRDKLLSNTIRIAPASFEVALLSIPTVGPARFNPHPSLVVVPLWVVFWNICYILEIF